MIWLLIIFFSTINQDDLLRQLQERRRLARFRQLAVDTLSKMSPSNSAEYFLLLSLLFAGSVSVLATPIGAGWDEETHVIRTYELANLELIPNSVPRNQLPFPRVFWDLSYRRNVIVRPVAGDFWGKYGDLPIGGMKYIYDELPTRSVYSPLLLAPHALILRYLGLTDRMPALDVYLLARLAGLLTYTAICWIALRLMPYGKWIFAVVAALPTAIFQASTIGADPLSNAFSLLFIASTLHLAERKSFRWRHLGLLLAATAILFTSKPNMVFLVLLPFLVIRPRQFGRRALLFAYAGFVVLLGVVEVGGWNLIASSRFFTPGGSIEPISQVRFVILHPLVFGSAIWSAILHEGASYLRSVIAELGYQYWGIPRAIYLLSGGSLVAAMIADGSKLDLKKRVRLSLGGLFVVGFFGTFLALYLANTPVGSSQVLGVQGRYFSVWILLAAVALTPPIKHLRSAWTGLMPGLLGSLAIGFFTANLYLVYHVTCGGTYLGFGLCHLPQYKNWAPQANYSRSLSSVGVIRQEILVECNGLTSIEVWADRTSNPGVGQAIFEVRDETRGVSVASRSLSFADFPKNGVLVIPFSLDHQSQGDVYSLTIARQSGSLGPGPRFSLTIRPEYRAGDLTIGGRPSSRDLVFKYGCQSGLSKYLPSLFSSQVQSGE